MSRRYCSVLCLSILSCLAATSASAAESVNLQDYQGNFTENDLDDYGALIGNTDRPMHVTSQGAVVTQLIGPVTSDAVGLDSAFDTVFETPVNWSLTGQVDGWLTGMKLEFDPSIVEADLANVTLNIQNTHDAATSQAIALDIFADVVKLHNIDLSATARDATALGLALQSDAPSTLTGNLILKAHGPSAKAITLTEGSVILDSNDRVELLGNIDVHEQGSMTLNLKNAQQTWIGNADHEVAPTSCGTVNLALSNGAQWSVTGTSQLSNFDWKKDGIVQIDNALIKNNFSIESAHTLLENGAVVAFSGSASEEKTINIDGIANTEPVELKVRVNDWQEGSGPITLQFAGPGANNVSFTETPWLKDTLLTQTLVHPVFGTPATPTGHGITVTGTHEEVIGLSPLAKNLRDATDAHTLAIEAQSLEMLRLAELRAMSVHEQNSGLWVSVKHSDARLSREDRADDVKMRATQLTIGADTAMTLYSQPTSFGVVASFADHDHQATGFKSETQSYALEAYASTLTDKGNRFFVSAHYGLHRGDDTYQTGLTDTPTIELPIRAKAYGADLYWGAPYNFFDDSLTVEPYARGGVYRVQMKSQHSETLHVDDSTRTLSLAGLGTRLAWAVPETDWQVNADLAWMHRFGSKATLLATAQGESPRTLMTDRLQESWGAVDLSLSRALDRSELSFNIGCTQAHDMKERVHVGGYYRYRF